MRKLMAAWLAAALIAPVAAEAQRARFERGPGGGAPGAQVERGPGANRWGQDSVRRPAFEDRGPPAERPDRDWNRLPRPDAPPPPPMARRDPDSGPRPDGERGWQGRARPVPLPIDGAAPLPPDAGTDRPRWRNDAPRPDGGWNRPDAAPRPPIANGRGDEGRWADGRTDRRDILAGRRDGWDRARQDRRLYDRGPNDRRPDRWADRGWQDRNYQDRNWQDRNWSNRGWADRGGWDRGWHGQSRFDWVRYRDLNRNAFRLPRYYAPYDWTWGYRRFDIGVTLSSGLWGQNYWISDPFAYRLPEVYGPYRWVRYYNDALLVDLETGEVVDAVYGIFW